jgi:putative salt-induced outer membrane protein YdiY
VTAVSASADEVVLRNGDRITGAIVSLADGKLVVRTAYAGEVALDWASVTTLSTDAPLLVMRRGESPQRLRLFGDAAGYVRLGERPVALAEIAYLNPKPYESGVGVAYSGRATLSAAYSSGNAPSQRLYGDGAFTARGLRRRLELSATFDRHSAPAEESSLAWRGAGNYDHFLDPRRFLYTRASLEHDRAKDIERRRAVGAGVGAQLFESSRTRLSLRAGLDRVDAHRTLEEDEHYPAFGWAIKGEHEPWPNRRFFHEQEGYWNLEDTTHLFVRTKTGLRMPLVAQVGARVQLNVDWERRPAPGRHAVDATLLLGLDYSF